MAIWIDAKIGATAAWIRTNRCLRRQYCDDLHGTRARGAGRYHARMVEISLDEAMAILVGSDEF
jgi:hypothetical protein